MLVGALTTTAAYYQHNYHRRFAATITSTNVCCWHHHHQCHHHHCHPFLFMWWPLLMHIHIYHNHMDNQHDTLLRSITQKWKYPHLSPHLCHLTPLPLYHHHIPQPLSISLPHHHHTPPPPQTTVTTTTTLAADSVVRSAEFSQLAAQISSLTSSFTHDPSALHTSDLSKYDFYPLQYLLLSLSFSLSLSQNITNFYSIIFTTFFFLCTFPVHFIHEQVFNS